MATKQKFLQEGGDVNLVNENEKSKVGKRYEAILNNSEVHDQIIDAFDEREKLSESAKKLLINLDMIMEKMIKKGLQEDAEIIKKTEDRFIRYINKIHKIKVGLEKRYGSWNVGQLLNSISYALPIAQKNGNSGGLVYVDGKGPGFNQFTSDQLEYAKTLEGNGIEIINFLLTEDGENLLMNEFGLVKRYGKITSIESKYVNGVNITIDDEAINKNGKRVFLQFDNTFLDSLVV